MKLSKSASHTLVRRNKVYCILASQAYHIVYNHSTQMYSLGCSSEVLAQVRIVLNTSITLSAILLGWDSERSSVTDEHRADYGDKGGQFTLQRKKN